MIQPWAVELHSIVCVHVCHFIWLSRICSVGNRWWRWMEVHTCRVTAGSKALRRSYDVFMMCESGSESGTKPLQYKKKILIQKGG